MNINGYLNKKAAGWVLFGALFFAATTALPTIQPLARDEQRQRFLEAEKALSDGDQQGYSKLKAQLADYPLLPYLIHDELSENISSLNSSQAEDFLTRYSDTPLAPLFRSKWLSELARKKQWWAYRAFYKPRSNSKLKCHYLQALIETGERQQAFDAAPALWLTGKSQPDACDPVFDAWRQAGKLTQTLTWQRLELAMEAGNLSLARYLSRFLNTKNKQWYEYWIKIHNQPAVSLNQKKSADKPVDSRKIWIHGLKRLARSDIEQALAIWKKQKGKTWFSEQQRYQVERYLALRLLYADHPLAASRLAAFTPDPKDLSFIERRLRFAVTEGDWPALLGWLENSPAEIRNEERWRYWQAHALATQGQKDESKEILQHLAKERSYHGFLAADRLGLDYNLNDTPLQVSAQLLTSTSALPALHRAGELIALDRYFDARREWYRATRPMSDEQLQAAAKIAQSWNWHDQAIFTLAKTNYWEDLELRFPVRHQAQVDRHANNRQLDNAWVFAVIRQESAFSHDAQSHAGALGLMQLMPNTAKSVAKRLKHKRPVKKDLLKPRVNINLGTAYLRQVLDQLGDHQVLATAAYNAGPHRVKSWLPEQQLSADRWVESIPFNETRKYTERVMSYAVIYEQRLGKTPTRLNLRMSPVLPKKITTARVSENKKAL